MDPVESQRGGKRKRSKSDDGPLAQPPPPPPQSAPAPVAQGNVTEISYFKQARTDKLKLIEGDSEVFNDILGLIADYEGVLERHESVAANLGAKLVGPLLVKSLEKLFEGPIKILQSPYEAEAVLITWLDIVEFAGTEPNSFMLNDALGGGRVCQFWIKDCLVEISEDDYRLILSGAPKRMIPREPVREDEIAEVSTLEIVEQRLNALIKKADLVAGHARQLRHRLKSRKAAIQAPRSSESKMAESFGGDSRQPSAPFQAINNRNPVNGEAKALHEDLLRQFQTGDRKAPPSSTKAKGPRATSDSNSPSTPSQPNPKKTTSYGPRPAGHTTTPSSAASPGEIIGGQYRPAMMARMEKLARGDAIWPPCDRCRRLRIDCTKYLTACSGCTRKHAKCSWYALTPIETSWIVGGFEGDLQPLLAAEAAAAAADGDEDTGNGDQYSNNDHLDGGGGTGAPDLSDPDANLHPDLRSGSVGAGDVRLRDHQPQHGNGHAQRGNTNGEASAGGSSSSRRSASAGSGAAAGGKIQHRASPATSGGLLLRGSGGGGGGGGGRTGRNTDGGASSSSGGPGDLHFSPMGGSSSTSSAAVADRGEREQQQHR